jgi:cytochrome c-type protein NapC
MTKWLAWLFKPSGIAMVYLLLIGLGFGAFSVVAFNLTMDATNTEEFCTSCHVMASGPGALIKDTTHFANKSGVRPVCSDCHVPKEFFPKIWRKIQASREVWGNITGIIDTPEKYLAHVATMKAREVDRMRRSDSRECRNCHDVQHMILTEQTAKAREFHQTMAAEGKTCIDCHQGLAHMSPEVAEQL